LHPPKHGRSRGLCQEAHTLPTQARRDKKAEGRPDAPRYNPSRGVSMASIPRDLRDALVDVDPKVDRAPALARTTRWWMCSILPAPGAKLRYCGRCETAAYCSKLCARAD